jgi:VWFA-related protein
MRRWVWAPFSLAVLALWLVTSLHAASSSRATFVELDVVALDSEDRPVEGLHPQDFIVKEDGHPVAITSFTEVITADNGRREDGRSLVLLLDDSAPPIVPQTVQAIAAEFLSRARPNDIVDVVRLYRRDDNLSGNLSTAANRVATFVGGSGSFDGQSPADHMLRTLTRISRSLQSIPHRRKAIVCIGHRFICATYFHSPDNSIVWQSWRDAISAAADAHVSLYSIDTAGNLGGIDVGSAVVDETGGVAFGRSSNFDRVADLVWEQIGHYYLLGYTPTAKPRDLHTVNVSILQSGVRALARHTRGD